MKMQSCLRWGCLSLLVLLLADWLFGGAGWLLRDVILPRWLPYVDEDSGVAVLAVHPPSRHSSTASQLQLVCSVDYLKQVLRASPFPFVMLPPRTLVAGMELVGTVPVGEVRQSELHWSWRLDDSLGSIPELTLRLDADLLNEFLRDEFAEDWVEREDYWLGHYELEQQLWFDTLTAQSEAMGEGESLYPLRIRAVATGRMRYHFRDGPVVARWTAQVKHLEVLFMLNPILHDDGIGFDYRAEVVEFDISVDRMAPWVEKRLARSLRDSMQRSLNKGRKRQKLAAHRLPHWLPPKIRMEIVVSRAADEEE